MNRWRPTVAVVLAAMTFVAASARASGFEAEPAPPKLGLSILAGIVRPVCGGHSDDCTGRVSLAPSVQGRFLFAPTARWAFGLVGELSRFHPSGGNSGHPETYSITTGFAGFAAQLVLLPNVLASPVASVALGVAGQSRTGTTISCSDGLVATGELAVGERVRLNRSVSLLGLASAAWGRRRDCNISDAEATPFVAWAIAVRAGATFDLSLGGSGR
jgi:hypothetical protein